MSKTQELLAKSQSLPSHYRLSVASLDEYIRRVNVSWSTPRRSLPRKLKVRPSLLARLSAEMDTYFDDENLDCYLPPREWLKINARDLQDSEIHSSFQECIDILLEIHRDIAASKGALAEYQTFVSEFINGGWSFWLNPCDFHHSNESGNFDYFDLSTSMALGTLIKAGLQKHDALLVYAGLLAGAMSQPRTSQDWEIATSWVLANDKQLSDTKDFFSARAWLLSSVSPLYVTLDETTQITFLECF